MTAILLAGIGATCYSEPDCEVGVTVSGLGAGDGNYMRPNWYRGPLSDMLEYYSTYTKWGYKTGHPYTMLTFVSHDSLQDPLKYLPAAKQFMNKWIYWETSLPYEQGYPHSGLKIHAVCEAGCHDMMWPQHGVLETQWRMLENSTAHSSNNSKLVNVTGECCKRKAQSCDDASCRGLPYIGCLHKSECCETTTFKSVPTGCHKLQVPLECADPTAVPSISDEHRSKSASLLI